MKLVTDEEAEARLRESQARKTTMWGVPVPKGEWAGPGAAKELGFGRGDDDDGE